MAFTPKACDLSSMCIHKSQINNSANRLQLRGGELAGGLERIRQTGKSSKDATTWEMTD